MEKKIDFLKRNKYWILAVSTLAVIAGVEHNRRIKAEKSLYLKEGKDENQTDMIKGLTKEIKNLSYHLGKSRKDEG